MKDRRDDRHHGVNTKQIALRVSAYVALLGTLYFLSRRVGRAYEHITTDHVAGSASSVFLYFLGFLLVGGLLAVLAAWDISRLLGAVTEEAVLGGGSLPENEPRLLEADRLRKEGEPLEAVRVLREHLTEKPRDWQTNVRIAEVYTHDLRNPLAAALEYEQLLQRRLPRGARAWLMVRLADNYLLLRRGDEAVELFEQVTNKFPRTPAAKKAARRLERGGLRETEPVEEAPEDSTEETG